MKKDVWGNGFSAGFAVGVFAMCWAWAAVRVLG